MGVFNQLLSQFGKAPTLNPIPAGPSYPLTSQEPLYSAPGPTEGMAIPGNINLKKLPIIKNPDGSYSTVNSSSFYDEKPGSPTYGHEVLVRGILNGRRVEDIYGDDEKGRTKAINALKDQYYKTGEHLGAFKGATPDDGGRLADVYSQRLHQDWADGKIPGVAMREGDTNAGYTNPQP